MFPLGDTIDFISQVSKVRRCTTTFYRHLRSPENPPPKKNKKKWRLFGSPVRRRSIETADAVWSSKATNWFNYGVSPFAGRTQRKTSNQKKTRIFFYLWSFLALVDARKNRQTPVSLHDRHRACACWLADFIYRNPKFLISPHGTCCPLCFAFLFVSVGEMKAIVTSFSFPFSFSLGKSFTKPFFSSFFFLGALRFSFFSPFFPTHFISRILGPGGSRFFHSILRFFFSYPSLPYSFLLPRGCGSSFPCVTVPPTCLGSFWASKIVPRQRKLGLGIFFISGARTTLVCVSLSTLAYVAKLLVLLTHLSSFLDQTLFDPPSTQIEMVAPC